jgi:hypothetical protein
MKYLKTFEGRFKGLDKQEIEDNIEGILVDLYDDGLEVAIDWLGGGLPNPNGLEIHIQDSTNRIRNKKEFFISEDYIDHFLTAVDYLKKQWGDVEVKYEVYNENSNLSASFEDSTNLNYLGELKKVTEFQITVKKVNSTPKKLNERLGIIQDMEKQVEEYMKTIESKPIAKVFKLVYSCDLGNYFFKLIIDPKLEEKGYFTVDIDPDLDNRINGEMTIYLNDRKDESTLLHEVKHLDYFLRKKGKTKNIYTKTEIAVSNSNPKYVSKKSLAWLEHIFYIFDENEFQSKYQSFYKDFDLFLSKQTGELTTTKIRELFFSEDWVNDMASFRFYTLSAEFKFDKIFPADELRVIFNYIIHDYNNKRKVFKNPYLDLLSYLSNDIKKNIKMRFRLFNGNEKKEIERYITFFEKDINRKIKIYKKRMSRIVTLACEKYVK